MGKYVSLLKAIVVLVLGGTCMMGAAVAAGDSAAELEMSVNAALEQLYAEFPATRELARSAKGVLVFPSIVKGGFMVGGLYGEGALRMQGGTVGYYNTVAASYGWQAGVQRYGYALFFMTNDSLAYIDRSDGWEIGIGPSIVIVDEGLAKSLTSTTAKNDVYAFFFNQKGLMAGAGLQGSKITKIKK